MMQKTKKILFCIIISIIIFSFFTLNNKEVSAFQEPNRIDFKKLSLFPKYAKSLINLKYFSNKNLNETEKNQVKNNWNNDFKKRLRLFYDLHLYGEANMNKENGTQENYYNLFNSSLEPSTHPDPDNGDDFNSTYYIHFDGIASLSIQEQYLFPIQLTTISKDSYEFLRFYNTNALYNYLIQSCNEKPNKDSLSANRYCIDLINDLYTISDSNYILSESINDPISLQQMYWNTKSNLKTKTMEEAHKIILGDYSYSLKNSLDGYKKEYLKKNKGDEKKTDEEIAAIKKQANSYLKTTKKYNFNIKDIESDLKLATISDQDYKQMKSIIKLCTNKCNNNLGDFDYIDGIEKNQRQIISGGLGPVIESFADFSIKLISSSYQYINSNFSEDSIKIFKDPSIFHAWKYFKNLINFFVIIIFMIIIFSQLTSFGLNNYSIKKILPKLIVFSILINISYYLVLFAIDISNILGDSLFDLFKVSTDNISYNMTESILHKSIISGFVSLILAFFLAIINIPFVLISFLLSCFLINLRTVMFILLTIFAPLGLLSSMTINFKKISKIWWHAFLISISIFPLFSLMNGGSILAFKLLLGKNDSNLGLIMPISMLFTVQSFGCIFIIKLLTKLPMLASIPLLSNVVNKMSINNRLQRASNIGMGVVGNKAVRRYKTRREIKMANKESGFYKYQSVEIRNRQEANQRAIANNLSQQESEFILKNGDSKKYITQDKGLRKAFVKHFGASNFDSSVDQSTRGADFYLAALENISKRGLANHQVNINLFLEGMKKAKKAGASEQELKRVYDNAIKNMKSDNNLLAVAELEHNQNFYSGLGNFETIDLFNSKFKQEREKMIKKVLSSSSIVKIENGLLTNTIRDDMISNDHIKIMKDMYNDPKYSGFKEDLDKNYNLLDKSTQDRLDKVMK